MKFTSGLLHRKREEELVLGRIGPYSFFPKFRISAQVRNFHSYVVGLTGRGKSKFLQNSILQDIQAGRGCAVIDPHGDLAKDVLKSLLASNNPEAKTFLDRIVYVSPRRRDYIIPFNVLERPDSITETYEVCQRVINSFMRTWSRTLQEPPRFQQIMRSSLAALVETEKTICDLYPLLTDEDFREDTLQRIRDIKVKADCLAFFDHEFSQWGRERTLLLSSTTNKVSALIENPNIFYMLGQKENQLNIRKIMDEGKILIIDLGECDDETKRLFGTLIVTGFEQAALNRARIPHAERKPYYLYIDEFQDFACHPGAAATFSQMLSQVRKFGLHMILANQSIAQLDKGLQTALSNAQTIVSFRISRADAEALSRVLGEVNPATIKRENQTEIQHPIYSPLNEQWEGFIQHLTRQKVRQATVKTADDRLAVIWAEITRDNKITDKELEALITYLVSKNGKPFAEVHNALVREKEKTKESTPIFSL